MIRRGAFRIAVDTGGTFTDVVISGESGHLAAGKSLTTPERVFDGFLAAVDRAAESLAIGADQVLRDAQVIVYGTTHATNAVITGATARTALLVTEGFADTLIFREGGRRNVFDSTAAYPLPYVPRRLTFEVPERLSAEGEVLVALDEARVREVLAGLADHAVEALAVMFLWSVVDPVHELRVGELIDELLPGLPYTLSHRANPVIREYRRAAAASIDASLKPLMRRHLRDLHADLLAAGYGGELMVVTSEGGVLDVESVAERPILAVNSGPSMAPLAGASFAPDAEAVVVCDMGGTTFDVSLVEHGTVRHTRDSWLGEPFVGELTGLSSVAVKSIGAGGGSIAWIDPGGLLRVGPQSAGSAPGPAAYGRGGSAATITDAAVVLGYLDATAFEGGFTLDAEAASDAVLHDVAGPLGLSVEAAANAVFEVAANQMATAIRQATLEEGVDPRGTVIVAGGGAGPMLAAWLADALGLLWRARAAHGGGARRLRRRTAPTSRRSSQPPSSSPAPPSTATSWSARSAGSTARRRPSSTASARCPRSAAARTSSRRATRPRRGTCACCSTRGPTAAPAAPRSCRRSTTSTTAATASATPARRSSSSPGGSAPASRAKPARWRRPKRTPGRRASAASTPCCSASGGSPRPATRARRSHPASRSRAR